MSMDSQKMIAERDAVICKQAEQLATLRKALQPFAESASRPGRLDNFADGNPLPDDVVLGLGVKVSAWREAIRLVRGDPHCG